MLKLKLNQVKLGFLTKRRIHGHSVTFNDKQTVARTDTNADSLIFSYPFLREVI